MTRARAPRSAPTAPTGSFAAPGILATRRALVTGGTRGIGRAIAIALASAGADVTATWTRTAADAEATHAALSALGASHSVVRCDVGDADEIAALFATLSSAGGVDILVNNAAMTQDAHLMMLSDAAWNDVLRVNLGGPFLCVRHALRGMIARGFGRIVNIVSPAGIMGKVGAANYAASKGGLLALTRTLAAEVASFGITVNAVCPGIIDTAMVADLPPPVRADMVARVPAGRLGRPEEVANAVLFLALPHAAYVTGAMLGVDGGLLTG